MSLPNGHGHVQMSTPVHAQTFIPPTKNDMKPNAALCMVRSLHSRRVKTYRRTPHTAVNSIPWPPVLRHIPPPHLRCEDAISKLLNKVEFSDHLPLFSDVTDHPTLRLPSRHPVWSVNPEADTTASVSSRWHEDWQSATVINSSLVDDPTVRLPSQSPSSPTPVAITEPFPDRRGRLRHMSKEMGSDR